MPMRPASADVVFIQADVSNEEQVRDSLAETVARFDGLHIIVNCAGLVHVKRLHEYDEADWDRLMGVNLKSIFFSVKHGLPYLRRQPAKLRRERRVDQQLRRPGRDAGLHGFKVSRARASRARSRSTTPRSGLRCNCVCPGITDTPMLREHLNKTPDPEATLAERLRRVPMRLPLTASTTSRGLSFT